MNYILVTNNDRLEEYTDKKIFINGSSLDVLLETRNLIHKGYKLISSPIGASIRIMMSPIRTIVLESQPTALDEKSLQIIESAIEKHILITANRGEDITNEEDYKIIDLELLSTALKEA